MTNHPRQIIYYGAPGTGKSFAINEITKGQSVIRTTFHPDSDYSTFVGSYKPVMTEEEIRAVPVVLGTSGTTFDLNNGTLKEKRISYNFVKQAFMKAYLSAWKKYAEGGEEVQPQFLVIEEINRGNCAQIFGDLFQLLDRDDNQFSKYPIEADSDLQEEIRKSFADKTNEDGKDNPYHLGSDINVEGLIDGYTSEWGHTLSEDIQAGRVLLLPPNLYIWATMNTSDQSLFPIDSAFKRRWEWKYVKIAEGRDRDTKLPLGWMVGTEDCQRSWWEFIRAINVKIDDETHSDDKKLGYFFCKPPKGKTLIDPSAFVGKVVFYLWNDIFKDSGNQSIFKVDTNQKEASLDAFYVEDPETGLTNPNHEAIKRFLLNVMGEPEATETHVSSDTATPAETSEAETPEEPEADNEE